jgi:hypothetical protein
MRNSRRRAGRRVKNIERLASLDFEASMAFRWARF